MTETMTPPPGWYKDGQNPGWCRFWDGSTWTGDVQALSSSVALPLDAPRAEESAGEASPADLVWIEPLSNDPAPTAPPPAGPASPAPRRLLLLAVPSGLAVLATVVLLTWAAMTLGARSTSDRVAAGSDSPSGRAGQLQSATTDTTVQVAGEAAGTRNAAAGAPTGPSIGFDPSSIGGDAGDGTTRAGGTAQAGTASMPTISSPQPATTRRPTTTGSTKAGSLKTVSTKSVTTKPVATSTATTKPPTTKPPTTGATTKAVVTTAAPSPTRAAPTTSRGSSGCDPNYGGGCVPIADDVDCGGQVFVDGLFTVVGTDIYGLDPDGDGVACN